MDTRRILTTVLVCSAIFLAMKFLMPGFFGGAAAPTSFPAYGLYASPATQPSSERGAAAQQILLGNADSASHDKVAVTVNTLTAGIDLVQLNVNDYTQDPKVKGVPPKPLTLLQSHEDLPKPFATLTVQITDADGLHAYALYTAQYVWKAINTTRYQTDLVCTLENDKHKPLVEITKTFTVRPDTYEVIITHTARNLTGKPLTIQIDQLAATDLPRDNPQMDDRFFHAANLSLEKQSVETGAFNLTHTELQKLDKGTRPVGQFYDYAAGKDPFLWVAASNRFFVAITRPLPLPVHVDYTLDEKQGIRIPEVTQIASADIDILHHDDANAPDTVGAIRLTGSRIELPAKSSLPMGLSVYLGPKERDILAGKASMAPGTFAHDCFVYQYIKLIQFSAGSCFIYSACPVDFLALGILKFLDFLVGLLPGHNYGIAIMVMVILVRAVLHPLTRWSQVNMAVMGKKMRAIQPELDTAKKKYAKDSKKFREEQMRIYAEHKVSPAGGALGCLPMLIQMPIWIALYDGLRANIDLRHATFIPGWINDLSNPDALFHFHPFTVPIMGTVSSFNLLPILLGIVFFVQMKVQSASQPAPADPSQAQMQKMSQYFILLFPLFLYSAPSGLNLYYFASTAAGLVDTYFVRKTLRARGILPVTASALPTHQEKED